MKHTPRKFIAVSAALGTAAVTLAILAPGLALAVDPLHPLGPVSLQTIVGRVINFILSVLGSLSLLFFVYGGFMWMTAAGNEEKIKKAKNTIVYSALGLIVAFASYAIVRFLISDVLRYSIRVQPVTPTNSGPPPAPTNSP